MSFENASVTKGLIIYSALSSLCVGIFDVKHYFHIQFVPHISRHHQVTSSSHLIEDQSEFDLDVLLQYWRLITHHLAFTNSSDLFLAELLFYNAGVHIERQFGSVKYASFAFVSLLVATLLEFITLILFHRVGINHFSMGTSALVFSIVYQYSRIVPPSYIYKVFGAPLSNKTLNYVLALQLACSRLPGSLVVAAIGIITGQIYRSDLANLNTYRLPSSILHFSSQFLAPLIGSLRPPRRSNRALPDDFRSTGTRNAAEPSPLNEEIITTARSPRTNATTSRVRDLANQGPTAPSVMREWVDGLTGRGDSASGGLRVPPETEIATLTGMFPSMDREVLLDTLQRSPNIEAAVETLLSSQI